MKREKKTTATAFDKKHFQALRSYIVKTARGHLKNDKIYDHCIRASLAKCYEFNVLARHVSKSGDAFFWLPSLRGICEDLIVLNFLKNVSDETRENIIQMLQLHAVFSGTECQKLFFRKIRPHQPTISYKNAAKEVADLEAKIQTIWKANGWPKMDRGTIPPLRQLAEKQDKAILGLLYDYLYRLTSGAVHFGVLPLLKTGWGDIRGGENSTFKYSTKNFAKYYVGYARIYGAFLFCTYFELFSDRLTTSNKVVATVDEIRKELLKQPLWPEIVTFEEMNVPRPKSSPLADLIVRIHQSETKTKLIE